MARVLKGSQFYLHAPRSSANGDKCSHLTSYHRNVLLAKSQVTTFTNSSQPHWYVMSKVGLTAMQKYR